MDELRKEYKLLFNGITDTIRQLDKMSRKLQVLQQRAEELCLEDTEAADDEAPCPQSLQRKHHD